MLRYKPKYNNFRLVHEDSDGNQTLIYCNNVSASKTVESIFAAPIKGTSNRFITDSDIDIKIDDVIYIGEDKVRITAIPEMTYSLSNNTRRGCYGRKDKLFETS